MGVEIERKFLVKDLRILEGLTGTAITQGYLASGSDVTMRVRRAGDKGYLTVKGPKDYLSCDEFEYEIPLEDALAMLERYAKAHVSKTRYLVPFGAHTFEVDVFEGQHAGLVMAEVELSAVDEKVDVPAWLGKEVTEDVRYTNSFMAKYGIPPTAA